MTTPERLRQRQRREGWGLVGLAALLVISTVYDSHEDREQKAAFRSCVVEQVQGIRSYLEGRSQTTQRTSDATSNVIVGVAEALSKQDFPGIQAALNGYVVEQESIKKDRKRVVLPSFPSGECE